MKLLIVDDHPLFREGLCRALELLGGDVEIHEATNFEEATDFVGAHADLDLILLDLRLPGMQGYSGIDILRERVPDIPVVVVSAIEDRNTVLESLRHGAIGYIPKSSSTDVLVNALNLVLAGGKYLPPIVAGNDEPGALHEEAQQPPPDAALAALTPRQRDVLALIGRGKSNKDIAASLGLAEGTVKIHVTAILKVLKATNRTQAAMAAARMGLVRDELPDP